MKSFMFYNYNISMRMPLRFVWGVEAVDNGDFLDPGDKGRMVADERFDLSSSEAQRWMLSFCKELRRSVSVVDLLSFTI